MGTHDTILLVNPVKLLSPALILFLFFSASTTKPGLAQGAPERFWIAGRYDGNRVIVYFDVVKFGIEPIPGAAKISFPVANRFFGPVALPESYVAQFQKTPTAERFKLGDRYDLLLEDGIVAPFILTTLVGF